MTTPATTPAPSALQQILQILVEVTAAAQLAAPLTGPIAPEVAAGALLASKLESIAQLTLATYESHVGQPMDLALLHHIEPIPDPSSEAPTGS